MIEPAIHPRLRSRAPRIAELLGIDDATELHAALDDLQTLLHRCGYHLDLLRFERGRHLNRRRNEQRLPHPARGPTPRGRRPGSANWAQRQLGLGLAQIYAEQSGRAPTRRYDSYGDGREHGPFREFVVCVVDAVPKTLRATRKGHVPQVDYLVRAGIDEFKAAQRSGDEARRRGLLNEDDWLPPAAPEGSVVAP